MCLTALRLTFLWPSRIQFVASFCLTLICFVHHCSLRSRSHSATRLPKVESCQEEPYNTNTWAGRWSHRCEPHNKHTSSLKLSPTLNSLLAGLNGSTLLIKGQGENRQLVSNRVHKIQQHYQVKWYHVPTEDNPADPGSRGGNAVDSHLWKHGPTWLRDPSSWPPDIILEPTAETMTETKVNREIISHVFINASNG